MPLNREQLEKKTEALEAKVAALNESVELLEKQMTWLLENMEQDDDESLIDVSQNGQLPTN